MEILWTNMFKIVIINLNWKSETFCALEGSGSRSSTDDKSVNILYEFIMYNGYEYVNAENHIFAACDS